MCVRYECPVQDAGWFVMHNTECNDVPEEPLGGRSNEQVRAVRRNHVKSGWLNICVAMFMCRWILGDNTDRMRDVQTRLYEHWN